jgi:Ca2+-transporting ATPase
MNRGATAEHELTPPPAAPEAARPWHQMSVEAVLEALQSTPQGRSAEEAQRRLATDGPNEITEGRRRTPLRMFVDQFTDFMILVLLAAAIISGLIGEAKDTIAIVVIVVLNAVIGFIQEYRAERAMEALKAMAAPTAMVMRDGATVAIPASEVVAGDVVLLEAGGIVPADLRLLDSAHLRVDESALTGESIPVENSIDPIPDATPPSATAKTWRTRARLSLTATAAGW